MSRIHQRLSMDESNNKIYELMVSNPRCMVSRVGLGGETAVTAYLLSGQQPTPQIINWFKINAGFYGSDDFMTYAQIYKDTLINTDLYAYWNFPGFVEMEDFLVPQGKILIEPASLESFRYGNPWTTSLKSKKILIITPFKESVENQLMNRDKIWTNPNVLPEAEYIIYKSVQSIGGVGPHKDWYESFDIMKEDISKIDFDVALLGCGSYGLPLCNYIKMNLNKSCVYVGGGLQLYFGIKGKRWDTSTDVTKHYNKYWIRPNETEIPQFANLVEGGCYW
jgi:hypothetical protein